MDLKDKKILVVGLARTGASVARFLAERGAVVTVTDMKGDAELASLIAKLNGLPINFRAWRPQQWSVPYR